MFNHGDTEVTEEGIDFIAEACYLCGVMKRMIVLGLVLACGPFVQAQAPAASAEIKPADFQAIFDSVRPKRQEKWQTIPWMTDLLAARDQAAKEGKPLFMWSMNGHPLGCT